MNLLLMQHGYPPAIILKVDRKRYYRVLNEANLGMKEPYDDFIGRSIERSLIIYLNSIEPNQNEERMFINLKEAAQYCSYSQEYLSLLARKGRIAAVKINKDWMTTKEAIEEYIKDKN
jgi:Fic family protein